jgi:hypothetical protein
MVSIGQFIGPRRVAIFGHPKVPNPTFSSRVIGFLLADAIVSDPKALSFDRSQGRRHRRAIRWSRNPISRDTVDNKIREPDEVRIEGTLSANPAGGLLPVLGAFGSIIRRDLTEIEKLRLLADAGPVVIVTPERPYPSMGIEIVDERHGNGQRVDVSLIAREVRILDPLFIAEVVDLTVALMGAMSPANFGAQAATSVADPGGIG